MDPERPVGAGGLDRAPRHRSPAPATPLDPDEVRRIESVLRSITALASIYLFANAAGTGRRSVAAAGASVLLGAAANALLGRLGFDRTARLVLAGTILVVVTGLAIQGLGVHDISLYFYPVAVVYAGVLLGPAAAFATAGLAASCVTALVLLEIQGLFGDAALHSTDLFDAATVSVMLLTTASIVALLVRSLGRSLADLRRSQQELTERAELLRTSEARWRSVVENAPDRILSLDPEGRLLDEAGAPCGETLFDLFADADTRPLEAAFQAIARGGGAASCELRSGDRWVQVRLAPLPASGGPAGLTAIVADTTASRQAEIERRRLEAQLQEAQKMEALGQLAGGVAHDFNNLLTVIGGNAALLQEDTADPEAAECLAAIVRAQERAATLVRQLLAFGRRQILQPRPVELGQAAEQLSGMLQRLVGSQHHFRVVRPERPVWALADPGQIEQLLINLVLNARDAVEEAGHIEVRVTEETFGAARTVGGVQLPPGAYAVLSVADDGCGMDESVRAQIFQPFFTTKPKGKGTGLGLASVYGIVQQSGGAIAVETAPGLGAVFSVYLPEVGPPEAEGARRPPAAVAAVGSGTVLVVDDDAPLRRLVERALNRAGYRVQSAENGREALALSEACGGRFDLVITDVVMPELGGKAFADRYRERFGPTPILFVSGYAHEVLGESPVLGARAAFLAKPFTMPELVRAVGTLLASASIGEGI